MKILPLLLRLFTARGWAGRLSALLVIAVTAVVLWHSPIKTGSKATPSNGQLQGRVIKVVDGDTLEILDETGSSQRIRLAFIDAPEHDQAFGTRSRLHLAELVFGRQVTVSSHGRDKYGRLLGDVSQGDVDVEEAQLAAGLAWHYIRYAEKSQPGSAYSRYQAAEQQARGQQLGLWQDGTPTPPWDFRRSKRH